MVLLVLLKLVFRSETTGSFTEQRAVGGMVRLTGHYCRYVTVLYGSSCSMFGYEVITVVSYRTACFEPVTTW